MKDPLPPENRLGPSNQSPDSAEEILSWLLDGDPSIRWQVLRDLTDANSSEWEPEQARLPAEGWASHLLSFQDETGRWTPRLYGKKWISTTYSLVLLRRMGLPPGIDRVTGSCRLFLDEGLRDDGGIDISASLGQSETCVTGMVLALLSWFEVPDPRRDRLVEYLLTAQMTDGGWNCLRYKGATHSSFHTTINVLEGLREYAAATGHGSDETERAEARGREFLLAHSLYRSHRTGVVVDPKMLRLSFPPRWRYDVLRCLDYFRSADAAPDERTSDAIEVLLGKRRKDGRWPLQQRYTGATWFEMEAVGQPSRWNTLRALRVLNWYDRS